MITGVVKSDERRMGEVRRRCPGGSDMLTIRLPKSEWGKAWRAMIEIAPVRLIADDPIYEVQPAHLELLNARGFTYEMVPVHPRRREKRRRGKAD
jgi:hypothetical protein